MGAQSAPAQGKAADMPDGFGVAVVREDGKWRCTSMRRAALSSLAAAETELRELRSAGAVFGLLDVDDEFFVIVRPAPAGTRLLSSSAALATNGHGPATGARSWGTRPRTPRSWRCGPRLLHWVMAGGWKARRSR